MNIIKWVSLVHDLGVILSSDLSFNSHTNEIYDKALGCIKNTCDEFTSIKCSWLYIPIDLVKSILDFGYMIWNTKQIGLINKLERMQIRFIRIVGIR